MNEHTPLTASDAARKAADLVGGERDRTHGTKRENFRKIAGMWNAWLDIRPQSNKPLDALDVGAMMCLLKLARTQHGAYNPDDYIDLIGYGACTAEIADQIKAVHTVPYEDIEAAIGEALKEEAYEMKELPAGEPIKLTQEDLEAAFSKAFKWYKEEAPGASGWAAFPVNHADVNLDAVNVNVEPQPWWKVGGYADPGSVIEVKDPHDWKPKSNILFMEGQPPGPYLEGDAVVPTGHRPEWSRFHPSFIGKVGRVEETNFRGVVVSFAGTTLRLAFDNEHIRPATGWEARSLWWGEQVGMPPLLDPEAPEATWTPRVGDVVIPRRHRPEWTIHHPRVIGKECVVDEVWQNSEMIAVAHFGLLADAILFDIEDVDFVRAAP